MKALILKLQHTHLQSGQGEKIYAYKIANSINNIAPNAHAFENKVFKNFKNLEISGPGATRTGRRGGNWGREGGRERERETERKMNE